MRRKVGHLEVKADYEMNVIPIALKTKWELFVIGYWLIVTEEENPFSYFIYYSLIK